MTLSVRLFTLRHRAFAPRAIAPLVTFRILFGALMMIGALRFMWTGWIERLYLEPTFFFKYPGFQWVQPFGEWELYLLFVVMALSALGIMLGALYRVSATVFFLTFTYAELLDATNYLNHYYLVVLLAFWLIWLPAHRAFSLDARWWPKLLTTQVPAWTIAILQFQLGVLYFFAGVAKLHPDWLLRAMPLGIWLPERAHIPVLGYFFQQHWVAYVFSWVGALYDLSVAFLLLNRRTRPWAYLLVVAFHLLTHLLFNIGLFPFIMISSTLIFFSADWHRRALGGLGYREARPESLARPTAFAERPRWLVPVLTLYVVVQLLLPLRHWLYPGRVLWTEEGYRLSWRVMVLEKSGTATFTVRDPHTGRQTEVTNRAYLTEYQEKQMAIQPDFILQYAHHLARSFEREHGFIDPVVTADVHVAVNGRTSRRLIDPNTNLAAQPFDWRPRPWIIRY